MNDCPSAPQYSTSIAPPSERFAATGRPGAGRLTRDCSGVESLKITTEDSACAGAAAASATATNAIATRPHRAPRSVAATDLTPLHRTGKCGHHARKSGGVTGRLSRVRRDCLKRVLAGPRRRQSRLARPKEQLVD